VFAETMLPPMTRRPTPSTWSTPDGCWSMCRSASRRCAGWRRACAGRMPPHRGLRPGDAAVGMSRRLRPRGSTRQLGTCGVPCPAFSAGRRSGVRCICWEDLGPIPFEVETGRSRSGRSTRMDQSELLGHGGGAGTALDAELGEDAGNVYGGGLGTDEEDPGDLLVRATGSHQL
jgi:hypothetical protein